MNDELKNLLDELVAECMKDNNGEKIVKAHSKLVDYFNRENLDFYIPERVS